MHLIDLDQYPKNDCMYGGLGGAKVGITIDGEDYMVKLLQDFGCSCQRTIDKNIPKYAGKKL